MSEASTIRKSDDQNASHRTRLTVRLAAWSTGGLAALIVVVAMAFGGETVEDNGRVGLDFVAGEAPSRSDADGALTDDGVDATSEETPGDSDAITVIDVDAVDEAEVEAPAGAQVGEPASYSWSGELTVASPAARRTFQGAGGLVVVDLQLENSAAGVEVVIDGTAHPAPRSGEIFGVASDGPFEVVVYRTEMADTAYRATVSYPAG